ncbi:MAG: hypothetical protein ACE5NN_01975 [Candidatus Bathyarchaeia archaeon]
MKGFTCRNEGLERNLLNVPDFLIAVMSKGLDEETVRERQARVAKAGENWEEYVRLFLNEKLDRTGIEVIVGKREKEIKERSKTLWKMLSTPLKASTVRESVWGDIDLVAVKSQIPVAVISCKVSLHRCFTETLFCVRNIKIVM